MRIVKRCILFLLVSSLALNLALMQYGETPTARGSPSVHQGSLVLTGNNVTVIEGQLDINGSITVEDNATLILRNAIVNFTQTGDYQYSMTFQNPTNGNPRLIAQNATLTSLYGLSVNFYGNSSCLADGLNSWPISASHMWWMYGSNNLSISNSQIWAVIVYSGFLRASGSTMAYLQVLDDSASAYVSSSTIWYLTSFYSGAQCIVSDSNVGSIYTRFEGLAQLLNSTYSSLDIWDTSRITVGWYLDIKVVDMQGVPLDFVNVSVHYSNWTVAESKLTDVNGLARLTLTKEMINATGSYPVGYSSVDATHPSGAGAGQSISFTGNQFVTLTLPINAQDYIIIKPDGSITPLTATITTSDNVTYTFTGDSHASIIVDRSNIIIDGMGYTVQASGYSGFSLMDMQNVTIENTTITDSGNGFELYSSSNCIISGNNVTNSGYVGIYLSSSSNCTVSNNNITNNGRGIWLDSSSSNIVSGNSLANNTYGNFGIDGHDFSNFVNHIDPSNLANGKPIHYLMNESNIIIDPQTHPEGVGYLGLINCENVTVQDMTIAQNGQGLLIAYTNDSTITNNSFTDCYDEGSSGVILVSSFSCTLSGNNITNSWCGISVQSSSGNTFYHNNFINNTQHAESYNSQNTWDNGYPSGGNYWSDYLGVDLYHGSSQNVAGGDGIGDANYTIDSNNIDRYPLMGRSETFNAGVWNNTLYSVGIVSNSTITDFSFNQANRTVTFSVIGVNGSTGFCRVTIPEGLMWVNTPEEWTIIVNGTLLTQRYINESDGYTYIYFSYTHSTEIVEIRSTGVIPEFQPLMLLPLFMITTLLGAFILKRKRNQRI